MALIKCPECGREVSDKAHACIHCGYPIAECMNETITESELYQIILISSGANVVKVIKVVREITGFELPTAKRLVEKAPSPLMSGLTKKKAEEYANMLNMVGANVKVVPDELDTDTIIPSNIPKCPTCGSQNIKKISSTERAGSIIGFGIFSKNIGKTFECKNCGYKW